jgi:alkylation response protein AidB-like acyl-CoA dehydrogenase
MDGDVTTSRTGRYGEWPGSVDRLAADIASAAREIDESGRIPHRLLQRMHDAGAFRLLIPRSLDGFEMNLIEFMETIEQFAKIDASVAWCVGQASGCSFSAAYLDPAVAKEIFGPENAVVAWGPPSGDSRAVIVDGGYKLFGSWMYASGNRQATWLGAHAKIFDAAGQPVRGANGAHAEKTFMFPRSAAHIDDVWQVMGLRGTGSDTYSLDGYFVAQTHAYTRDSGQDRRESGPLYRLPILGTFAIAFASVALGIARATLDAFVELASVKTPKARSVLLRDSGVVQLHVGSCEARLRSARCYLAQTIDSLSGSLAAGHGVSVADRLNLRMAVTHTIQECRDIVAKTYVAAGASAIFEKYQFEKRFRDMHAVSQQIQGHAVNLETAGQVLLGVPGVEPRI